MNNQEKLIAFIKKEWEKRKKANPRFSQRALARYMRVTSSTCSEMLSGKRGVSKKMASQILERFHASPEVTADILAGFSRERNPNKDGAIQVLLKDFDVAEMWADWRYFGILSLLESTDLLPTKENIAKKLGLKSKEAQQYLKTLTAARMLVKEGDLYKLTGDFFLKSSDDVISKAVRKNHKECLVMAQECLETVSLESRDYTNVLVCIDDSQLPEFKKAVRDFHRKLLRISQRGHRNRVYRFATQLFPVTQE